MPARLHQLVTAIHEQVDAAHVVVVSGADHEYLIEMGAIDARTGQLTSDPSIRVITYAIPSRLKETQWSSKLTANPQ